MPEDKQDMMVRVANSSTRLHTQIIVEKQRMMNCDRCPLRGFMPIPPSGNIATAKHIVVGEAPGSDEVRVGQPFVGKSGRVLRRSLYMEGVNPDEVYYTNVVKCRPPGNKITQGMVTACAGYLSEELAPRQKDAWIYAAGTTARDVLVPALRGLRYNEGRGWHGDVCVGAHPAFPLYDVQHSYSFLMDIRRFVRGPITIPIEPEVAILLPEAYDKFLEVLDALPEGTFVAVDAETDQIDFQRNYVLSIAFSYAENKAALLRTREIYEPLLYLSNSTTGITPEMVREDTRDFLVQVFSRTHVRFAMHNAQFDLRFLVGQLGVHTAHCDVDTLLAHYCLWEYPGTHGLKELASQYLDMGDYEQEVVKYVKSRSSRYSAVPTKVLYKYNAIDTEVTRRLAYEFERRLTQEGMWERPFIFPLMTVLPMFLDAEIRGFPIDTVHMLSVYNDMQPTVDKIKADLQAILMSRVLKLLATKQRWNPATWQGRKVMDLPPGIAKDRKMYMALTGIRDDFNLASHVQISTAIYDILELPTVQARTISKGAKLAARSTAKESQDKLVDLLRTTLVEVIFASSRRDEILSKLEVAEHEDLGKWARQWDSLPKIMDLDFAKWGLTNLPPYVNKASFDFLTGLKLYRSLTKLQTSYCIKFVKDCGIDGAVHPRFKLYGTVTGRISASDPPIQTIPRDDDNWGKQIARGLMAPEGYSIVYADFSQCELRIAAHITQDKFMIGVLNKPDADFHSEVARAIYGPNFTKEQRNWYCKRAVFGWLYGGDVESIARDALRFPPEEAKRFAQDWNTNFADAVVWRKEVSRQVLRTGEVTTIFGRKRHFPIITNDNKIEAIHAAQNTPIQSPASDITLIAAYRLWSKYRESGVAYLLTTVHDSILMAVRDDMVDVVRKDLEDTMVNTALEFFPTVQHRAESKVAKRWGDLE